MLLDIGVLPNSQGSLVYSANDKALIAILLPTLNITRLYLPLAFAITMV
jgi:hypothetical protein